MLLAAPPCARAAARPHTRPAALLVAALLAAALLAPPSLPAQARPAAETAAAPAATDTSAGTAARDTAAVVVHERVVAVLRAPLGVLSPAERADAAAHRIEMLAETLADLPEDSAAAAIGAAATRAAPEGLVVVAAGRGLLTLTPADVDTVAGDALAAAGARAVAQLRRVLHAERESRSVAHLLRAVGLALAATAAFALALRLLGVVRRWLLARIPVTAAPESAEPPGEAPTGASPRRRRLGPLTVGGFTLLGADQLLAFGRRLVELAALAAGLVAAYVWLAFVLTRFPYSRPWGEALGAYLRETIADLALAAVRAVPGLFTVVLIFVATRWLARLAGTFFDAVEHGSIEQRWVHPETASATKRIVMVLLWLFALVVAYPYMPGSGSDVFKGVSVFAGLVLSLGSSGIVSQAMSGLVLMYSRALKPGDYVRVGEVEGTVTALGMLSTKIRSTKREEITLPNAVVVGASVKNYSRLCDDTEGVLVHTTVTIGYDVPWRQVEAMLIAAAERTAGLRAAPRPFVLKTGLSDFYIEYQLNAQLAEPARRIPVLSELHAHVVDVFNEHEVQILSPHYVADPAAPAVVPRQRWYAPPARPPVAAPAVDGAGLSVEARVGE